MPGCSEEKNLVDRREQEEKGRTTLRADHEEGTKGLEPWTIQEQREGKTSERAGRHGREHEGEIADTLYSGTPVPLDRGLYMGVPLCRRLPI